MLRVISTFLSEPFRNHVDRLAGLEEQRRAGVAESVELDRADAGRLDHPWELPLSEVVGLERVAERMAVALDVRPLLGKHQSVIRVGGPVGHLDAGLVPAASSCRDVKMSGGGGGTPSDLEVGDRNAIVTRWRRSCLSQGCRVIHGQLPRVGVQTGPAFCSAHRMHVGGELRAAREQQGLSLDELSARTKIGLERLKAIEDEEVDRLPPVVYLKGFVHAYAAEVGLDPSATTQRYLQRVDQDALGEFESEESEEAEYVFDEPASSDEHDTLQERHDEELLPESLSGDLPLRNVEDARGEPRARVHGQPTAGRPVLVAAVMTVIGLSTWAMLMFVSNREDGAPPRPTVTDQARTTVEETPRPVPSTPQAGPPEGATPAVVDAGMPAERKARAAKLTGEWTFTNHIESSRVPAFKGMTLGFRLRLVQDGTEVSGAGVKLAENGRRLPRRQQTPITLQGELEGNRLELTFSERGRRRTSSGAFVMHLVDDRSMSGKFSSDVAGSRGTSRAVRIASR
jgi:transcriptional regulator with XRE-family HTH domain